MLINALLLSADCSWRVKLCFCRAANFSQEPLLWSEMCAMSEALQSEFRDENTVYLRGCSIIIVEFSCLLWLF